MSSNTYTYSVETGNSFTYTVVPQQNSFSTKVKITYRTDGAKNADAEIFSEIKDHKEEMESEYEDSGSPVGIIIAVILILIIGGVGFYIWKKKKYQISVGGLLQTNDTIDKSQDPFTADGKNNLK